MCRDKLYVPRLMYLLSDIRDKEGFDIDNIRLEFVSGAPDDRSTLDCLYLVDDDLKVKIFCN